jgi:hypothetical protein
MWKILNWLLALLVVATAHATAGSLSGTYVGTGPDIAVLLQLVDAGGELTGRYEQVKLSSTEPGLSRFDAGVRGNADGDTIVFEMGPTERLSGSFVISGTVASSGLRLTGGGNGQTFDLLLWRSSEEAFNSQVAALTKQASQANAERTATVDSKAVKAVLEGMQAFNLRADSELRKLPSFEDRFRLYTKGIPPASTAFQHRFISQSLMRLLVL